MDYVVILGFLAAALTTGAFIPQAYKAWKSKSTRDISLPTYSILALGTGSWAIYGFLINSLPIILANVITFMLVAATLAIKLRHG